MTWISEHQTTRLCRGVPQRHLLGACLVCFIGLLPNALNSADVQKPCTLALYSSVMQTITLIYKPFPAVISDTGPFTL